MDIYRIIRLYRRIKSPRLKLLGILAMHCLHRRYLNLAFDPVLACNLRCRMCYYSDPEVRKAMGGRFSESDIEAIARSLFHRVLKLQIGCGAEPTVYPRLAELVKLAHEHGIPHISLTTNGNLLTREKLEALAANGLNELILSTHGMTKATYENLMQGAHFEAFLQVLHDFEALRKEKYPQLQLRINYTFNEDNIDELPLMPEVLAEARPNVIQIRPIQNIGNSDYDNFSQQYAIDHYEQCILPVVRFCQQYGITCLYPEKDNLKAVNPDEDNGQHTNSLVELLPYLYFGPHEGWKERYNPYEETFEQYSRRTHRVRLMLRHLFGMAKETEVVEVTKALNYTINN